MTFLCGCAKSEPKETPLMTIGNSVLLPSDLARATRAASPKDSATLAALFIEDWQRAASLYEQAIAEGDDRDEETQAIVEKSRRRIIAERFLARKLREAMSQGKFLVDSAEVKTYYERFGSTLTFNAPMFRLARLYAANADTALRFRQLLTLKLSLDSLYGVAMERSPETAELNQRAFESAMTLKTLPQLRLESDNLRAILERMKPGDVSPAMKLSESLFVAMRLEEIALPNQPKTLTQAYPDILERLAMMKQKRFADSLAARLKPLP